MLYLADRKHDVCILDSSGNVEKEFVVPHSPEGIDRVLQEIRTYSTHTTQRFSLIQKLETLLNMTTVDTVSGGS